VRPDSGYKGALNRSSLNLALEPAIAQKVFCLFQARFHKWQSQMPRANDNVIPFIPQVGTVTPDNPIPGPGDDADIHIQRFAQPVYKA